MFFHGENTDARASTTSAPRCTTPTACCSHFAHRRVAVAAARQPAHAAASARFRPAEPARLRPDPARPRLRPLPGPRDAPGAAAERLGRAAAATGATGRVELVEIPTDDGHQRQHRRLLGARRAGRRRASRCDFAYTLHWYGDDAAAAAGRPRASPRAATAARRRRLPLRDRLRRQGARGAARRRPCSAASSRSARAADDGELRRSAGGEEPGDRRLAADVPGAPEPAASRSSCAPSSQQGGRRADRDLVVPSRAVSSQALERRRRAWRPAAAASEPPRSHPRGARRPAAAGLDGRAARAPPPTSRRSASPARRAPRSRAARSSARVARPAVGAAATPSPRRCARCATSCSAKPQRRAAALAEQAVPRLAPRGRRAARRPEARSRAEGGAPRPPISRPRVDPLDAAARSARIVVAASARAARAAPAPRPRERAGAARPRAERAGGARERRRQLAVDRASRAGAACCSRSSCSSRASSPAASWSNVLPHQGGTWLEVAIALFFGALFGWISIGFWTAVLGFLLLAAPPRPLRDHATRRTPDAPTRRPRRAPRSSCRSARSRSSASSPGLRAIYDSLERTGALAHFDFFVPQRQRRPERRAVQRGGGVGRVVPRVERLRAASSTAAAACASQRKSGNVADFCRRWGRALPLHDHARRRQRHGGETLVRAGAADGGAPRRRHDPDRAGRRRTGARCSRACSSSRAALYGPMFAAGLHFWQLGDGQYWGHNAIIRIAPFMEHCGLPRLPGKPPLGGEILSHDFVEAALHGPRRLGAVARLRPAGQLRGDAVDAARGDEARPPLVPGQPAAPAPAVRPRACSARTARCS